MRSHRSFLLKKRKEAACAAAEEGSMASLIVRPNPEDVNVVDAGLEMLNLGGVIEQAKIAWQGTSAFDMVRGLVFGIWQNVDSVRKLLSVDAAAGMHLPSRGTYRFLAEDEHDLRDVLRAAIPPEKTRPSDLLILDESVNPRTGRKMEGTSLVHSTTVRGRILGHCLLNAFHAGAEASGFVDFEMKINRKTKRGYRRRGAPTREVARALHTPLRALALSVLDRERARGNQATTTVGDTGYLSLPFCRRLRRRGWHWLLAAPVDTRVDYKGERRELRDLFAGVRSLKTAGDAHYRVFEVIYPGYGPVRAFYVRFVDSRGDKHTLYLLTDLTKKRASARAVLRKYLRRWSIEVGHRQTKETFNLRGYHGHTLHGHINFYAMVLLAHRVAEAVLERYEVANLKVPTLAFRVRLAFIGRGAAVSVATVAPRGSEAADAAPSPTMMGTGFLRGGAAQTMTGRQVH